MSSYKELKIYQRSYKAAKAVYEVTKSFPKEERYGVIDQMRRAALSIPLNIAEGYAKKESQSEYKRFLMMATGSANELLVLIDFSKDIGYIDSNLHTKMYAEYEEIAKMLNGYLQTVKSNI